VSEGCSCMAGRDMSIALQGSNRFSRRLHICAFDHCILRAMCDAGTRCTDDVESVDGLCRCLDCLMPAGLLSSSSSPLHLTALVDDCGRGRRIIAAVQPLSEGHSRGHHRFQRHCALYNMGLLSTYVVDRDWKRQIKDCYDDAALEH
jgi:hypothetical protein